MEGTSQTIPYVALGVSVASAVYTFSSAKEQKEQLELVTMHVKNLIEINGALARDMTKLSESLNVANQKIDLMERVMITSGLIEVAPHYHRHRSDDEESTGSLIRQAEEIKKDKKKKKKKAKGT